MTDNNYAEVPWYDGTIRLVPVGSNILTTDKKILYVRDADTYFVDGTVGSFSNKAFTGEYLITISDKELLIKPVLPTAPGSLVSVTITFTTTPDKPSPRYYMLHNDGFWRSVHSTAYSQRQFESYILTNTLEIIFDASKP